jgi:hypothetical protein
MPCCYANQWPCSIEDDFVGDHWVIGVANAIPALKGINGKASFTVAQSWAGRQLLNDQERKRLIADLQQSSNCSHPIRLQGEAVNLITGEVGERTFKIACKDRREVLCKACSYLYRTDAWILASAGLNGGKGVPEGVQAHPRLFVTLTAPSCGAVHTIRDNGRCVQRGRKSALCVHGQPTSCSRRHVEDDFQLGQPLCGECFDYERAVLWNAHASRLWSVTLQDIRRSISGVDRGTGWETYGVGFGARRARSGR